MKTMLKKLIRGLEPGFLVLPVFIGLTVWLSFTVKKQNADNTRLESSIEKNRYDQFLLHNRINLLNDAFIENIRLKGMILSGSSIYAITQKCNDADIVPVLYLRAYSCEDCYSNIIKSIIERLTVKACFHIVSHSSNRPYIEELYEENIINDFDKVLWDDDEIYSNPWVYSPAELILVDKQQRINALLPLNFFLDAQLFSTYMTWVVSGS